MSSLELLSILAALGLISAMGSAVYRHRQISRRARRRAMLLEYRPGRR